MGGRAVLNQDRDAALVELEEMYIEIEMALSELGVYYYLTDRTDLDNWEVFLEASLHSPAYDRNSSLTYIPVWKGASDTCPYADPNSNYRLRFWHDYLHLFNDLDFSYESEKKLIGEHLATAREWGVSNLALNILNAEVAGQLRYHELKGAFPHNQAAFIDTCLRYGTDFAVRFQH